MRATSGSNGTSFKAKVTKQLAIIGQLGIPPLPGLESCLLPAASGQQSILAIAICFEAWAWVGRIMTAAQFGDIAIATLWPRRQSNAPISNARRKNLVTKFFVSAFPLNSQLFLFSDSGL